MLHYNIKDNSLSYKESSGDKPRSVTMSYPSRPLPSHLRQASTSNNGNSLQGQSPVLLARIAEKRQELENLKELRDLSAGLAGQMTVLEEKLATLSNGTEGTIQYSWVRLQVILTNL